MKYPSARAKIIEFREITEQVIKNTDFGGAGKPMRYGSYDAHAGGLFFTIIPPKESRDARFGMGQEQLWGVAAETKTRIAGHIGSLVLISSEDLPDRLIRRIHYSNGMLGISTERPVIDAELTTAVEWVRSPHLQVEAYRALTHLLPDEVIAINDQFQNEAVWAQEFQDEMLKIDKAMRPGPDFLLG